jgi:hypothetical protein
MIGKQAFRKPSITDQSVTPQMDTLAYLAGTMPKDGATNTARRIVTMSVTNALFQPATLKPIIRTKRRRIGITETNAAINCLG